MSIEYLPLAYNQYYRSIQFVNTSIITKLSIAILLWGEGYKFGLREPTPNCAIAWILGNVNRMLFKWTRCRSDRRYRQTEYFPLLLGK